MQVKWRDLVTVDYEVDFPTATSYELGLYSSGLQLFPKVVLGIDYAWGRVRRAGLVDIPAHDYEAILEVFAAKCLTSGFICHMSTIMAGLISSFSQTCDTLDEALTIGYPPDADTFEDATGLLNNLMAFHVLNWALPIDEILSRLHVLLGTRVAAREALLSLIVPFTSSHVLDALGVPGLKDRTALAHKLELHGKRQAQRLAYRTFSIWLKSRGNPGDLAFLTNLARLGRLVAEEEEQRRRIQNRWMTVVSMFPADFLQRKAEHLESQSGPPVILPDDDHSWEWLK